MLVVKTFEQSVSKREFWNFSEQACLLSVVFDQKDWKNNYDKKKLKSLSVLRFKKICRKTIKKIVFELPRIEIYGSQSESQIKYFQKIVFEKNQNQVKGRQKKLKLFYCFISESIDQFLNQVCFLS